MKKILVVEDDIYASRYIFLVIKNLGKIVVCREENKDTGKIKKMPSLKKIKQMIDAADIILLDHNLGSTYTGKDLLPFCKGKQIIGISSQYDIAPINFYSKNSLSDNEAAKESLRNLIISAINNLNS